MIKYFLKNDFDFNFEYDDFVSLISDGSKLYKSHFHNISDFVEYLDRNMKYITDLDFNNLQMKLYDGLLHGIDKPALYKFNAFSSSMSPSYFYRGNQLLHYSGKIIKKESDFEEGKPYYLENDEKIYFKIDDLRKTDKRLKKLERILKS